MTSTFATTESVGTSRYYSRSQLNEITRQVDVDAASLVFWLTAKGFPLDPAEQVYDAEDEQYHNEYGDDQVQIDNH